MVPEKIVPKQFTWGLSLLLLCSLTLARSYPQGVATTGGKAQPSRPLPAGLTAPKVQYVDIAAKAGLKGLNVSGEEQSKTLIVETTGTGVAIFDYDNDGLPDIFLVNGDRLEANEPRPTHFLYKNLGNLRFEDVTSQSGLVHTGWGQGVCAGDIDNDTHVDLFVTHWGRNVLFRNRGDGTFRDETQASGLFTERRRWGTGCAFLDYDRDGDLDLFVARYIDFDPAETPRPGEVAQCMWKGTPVVCGPRGLPGEAMALYRNDGQGCFDDVSKAAGVAGPKEYYGLTVLVGDFDNDDWPDVYVACDSTASLLYRNNKDGTFEEVAVFSGAAYNEDGSEQAGMGSAAGDFDRDGDLDIVKSNFSDDTPTLYRNHGDATFTDVTIAAGLAVHTKYLGWGIAFLDFDHDGWKDIFIANGHVYPEVDRSPIDESFRQERLLFWNRRDGEFFDISQQAGPAIDAKHASRGIAVGDLDNDGDLEIVVVNMHGHPSLLENRAAKGNSLLVRAITEDGRDAIGARITAVSGEQKQIDEVRSGGYHISQGDLRVHFGLGDASKVDLEVRWPQGERESFQDVEANQILVIRRSTGIIKRNPLGRVRPTRRSP